jgi:WD40 repeat protein
VLDGARLVGTKLDGANLSRVQARGADFTQAEAHEASLEGANLTGVVLRQSVWTACRWEETRLAGADVTACLPFWRLEPPRVSVSVAAGHAGDILVVAWRPDDRGLATGSSDGTVRLWDAATGRERSRLDTRATVFDLAWHPEGRWLANADKIRFGRRSDGRVQAFPQGSDAPHIGGVSCVTVPGWLG